MFSPIAKLTSMLLAHGFAIMYLINVFSILDWDWKQKDHGE